MNKQKKSIPSSTLLGVIERIQTVLLGALVFLLPMMFDMANTSYNQTKIALFLAVGSIVLLLWGVRFWARDLPGIHTPTLFWPGLALLLAGALSLVNASSPGTSLQALWVLGYFLLFYLYFANAVDQGQKLRFFLLAACLGTLFASGYGALQYYGILPGHPEYLQGAGNIISGLGNRNFLAEFLNSWVVFVPVLLLLFKTTWVRGLLLVCAGMAFAVLLLVNSIGALAGLLGGVDVLALGVLAHRASVRFLKPHWGWLLGWLGVLLLGGMLVALPSPLKVKTVPRQLAQTSPAPVPQPAAPPTVRRAGLLQDGFGGLEELLAFWLANSGDVRILDWWVGLEMFKAHPLFGVGLNHYGIQFLNYKRTALDALGEGALQGRVRRTGNSHNDYV